MARAPAAGEVSKRTSHETNRSRGNKGRAAALFGMADGERPDGSGMKRVEGDAQQAHAPERGERLSCHWSDSSRRAR